MRGSDPDAAVYWLARMIHGGEDPKFIARRMLIFASEDVGNADPQALLVAHAAFKAAESIGWPECRINLSQAAIYLALAPKSNASYRRSTRRWPRCATGRRARCPVICATGIGRVRTSTGRTATRTTSRAVWPSSSTCRTAWSAAASFALGRGLGGGSCAGSCDARGSRPNRDDDESV